MGEIKGAVFATLAGQLVEPASDKPLQAAAFCPTYDTVPEQAGQELTVALFVGGGLKTMLPKQMWDGILLQVNLVIAAASVVVLSVVILLFAVVEYIPARRDGISRPSPA
jgi:putative spermidine/putrescine transport system permease protein